MDKNLLKAFNNLSLALEQLVDSLDTINKSKETSKSSIVEAFKSLDVSEQLKSINEGVKRIQDDNKEIIKTQKKILSTVSISKPIESDKVGNLSNPIQQKNVKDGVKMILLIAVGVLSIGMAFKMIGDVDFKSVLALSIAIPLIALSFERIAKINVDIKSLAISNIGLIMISATIVAVSKILEHVIPITGAKIVTSLLIASTFVLLSSPINIISDKVKNIDIKNMWKLPVIFIAMSASILAVSKILSYVVPITSDKLLSTILISSAFILLSGSIGVISSKIQGIDTKNMWKLPIIFIAATTAIAMSSWILQWVKPVSTMQLITTVFIAGSFALLANSIGTLASSIKNVDTKNLWKLPLVLISASLAISLSSMILQWVRPVGLNQLMTVVFIAAAFTLLSFGLGKLAKSMDKIDLKNVALLPLVLVGVSMAIAYSSNFLSQVIPITFAQAVTTIFIAAAFTILSYGLPKISDAIQKAGIAGSVAIPIVLIALSAAILGSSHLLSGVQVIPIGTLINIALQAVSLTVMSIVLGAAIWTLKKLSINEEEAAMGGLSILIIATTLMASSLIISLGSYDKYPSLGWTVSVGASMLAFGVATALLGSSAVETGGLGLLALALGGIGMLLIAGTIVGVDAILGSGVYGNHPPLSWAMSVGLSMTAFGLAVGGLGLMIVGSLGIGYLALYAGASAVKLIASTIVETAEIISTGNFTGGPSTSWAMSTGLLLGSFGTVVAGLGLMVVGSLGIGYLALKSGSSAVKLIAQTIVDSSFILSKGNYIGGPTKQWAEGIALSIGAFSPVYKTLTSKGIIGAIFGGGGSSPAKMKEAIRTISEGIVEAAIFFSKNTAVFKNGPSYEWSMGVGKSIGAFAPVFQTLADSKSIFSSGVSIDEMKNAVIAIAEGIVTAGNFFSKNSASFNGSYPSYEWGTNVGKSIIAFGPAFDWANKNSGWFGAGTDFLTRTIRGVAESIVSVARILSGESYDENNNRWSYNGKINYGEVPENYTKMLSSLYGSFFKLADDTDNRLNEDGIDGIKSVAESIVEISKILSSGKYKEIPNGYMSNLTKSIMEYSNLIDYLRGKDTYDTKFLGITVDKSSEISRMADDYDRLSDSITNLSSSIESINIEKISALKTLSGSIVLMSLMDSDQFSNMMDTLESKAKIFVDVINDIESGTTGKQLTINTAANKPSGPGMQDVINVMNRIDARLGQISSTSNNISDYVTELRSSKKVGIKSSK